MGMNLFHVHGQCIVWDARDLCETFLYPSSMLFRARESWGVLCTKERGQHIQVAG